MRTLFTGDLLYTSFSGGNADCIKNFGLLVDSGKVVDSGPVEKLKEADYDTMVSLGPGVVMPALIDAHVHVASDLNNNRYSYSVDDPDSAMSLVTAVMRNARQLVQGGITVCRDLGSWNGLGISLRKAIDRGDIAGPRIIAAGEPLTVTGGSGSRNIGLVCDGPEAIRRGVRKQIARGADVIKLMVTGNVYAGGPEPSPPLMSYDEIRIGTETAHNLGKSVAVHTHGETGIRESVKAGVDSIEHGVYMTDDILDEMLRNGTFFVPTVSAPYYASEYERQSGEDSFEYRRSEKIMKIHNSAVIRAYSKGVKMAVGSDSGSFNNFFDTAAYELVLMHDCGIPAAKVLEAATAGNAELLCIGDTYGTLQKGKQADFILLPDDPVTSIEAVLHVKGVWKEGIEMQ